MSENMLKVGRMAYQSHTDGVISKSDMETIHKKITPTLDNCRDVVRNLDKELSYRIKRDLGVLKGPLEVTRMLDNILKDNKNLGLSKEELALQGGGEDKKRDKVKDLTIKGKSSKSISDKGLKKVN